MEKVVVIRFGELFLKGKNRDYFESLLIRNIKSALRGIEFTFERSQGRYFVEKFAEDDLGEVIERLKKVFGIHSLSVADKVAVRWEEDFPEIRERLAATARKIAEGADGKIPFHPGGGRTSRRLFGERDAAAVGWDRFPRGGLHDGETRHENFRRPLRVPSVHFRQSA